MIKVKYAVFTTLLVMTMIALNISTIRNTSKMANHKTHTVSETLADVLITAKIKASILRQPELEAGKIHVTTENKVVHLTGDVDTQYDENIVLKLARSVTEVKGVCSDLHVWLS